IISVGRRCDCALGPRPADDDRPGTAHKSISAIRFVHRRSQTTATENHHGISLRSRRNLPVISCGASLASHTIVSAPSSTERLALSPPISLRTQPGQIKFTTNFGNAAESCTVTQFSAVFKIQKAGAQPSAPPESCPPPLETLITRGVLLFRSNGVNARVTR